MNSREQLIQVIGNEVREQFRVRLGENSLAILESGGSLGVSGSEADDIASIALQALSNAGYVIIATRGENGEQLIAATPEAVRQITDIAIESIRGVLQGKRS